MEVIIYIMLALIAYWISGVIHELGHVIVGLLCGWKFYLLTVGPIGIKRNEQGKIVLYFEKNIVLWGGVGATVPTNKNYDNINVWKKVLISGPIASLIMGVIFLPIGILTNSLFLTLLGAMPLGMGIISVLPLPLKTGIVYTDGKRWSRLKGKGQEFLEEKSLFLIMQNTIVDDDFTDIKYMDIQPLIKAKDYSYQYYGYYYSYRYFKKDGNDKKMHESIEHMNKLKNHVTKVIIEDCKIS